MSNENGNGTALTRAPGMQLDTAGMSVMDVGNVLARSGYFKDARDASQAVVKVLYGQEIGIGPVSAMMGVHIIEGKPAPSANLIAARIKGSGRYDYRVREHSADLCRIEFFELARTGQRESLGFVEWSMEDARRANLGGRGPWKTYPRAMLFARAISEGARVHCPEIFGGAPVYTPEELGAEVDAEGNAIVQDAVVIEPAPPALNKPSGAQADYIRNMIKSHVFTDEERATIEARVVHGFKGSVSDAIDGIKAQLDQRKSAEAEEAAQTAAVPDAEFEMVPEDSDPLPF